MTPAMWRSSAAGVLALAAIAPAAAQTGVSGGIEATTDERRRGLSWSGGDASVSADVSAGVFGLEASARATALRGSARHAGADGVVDLTIGKGWDIGPFRVRGQGIGHLFVDAGRRMDYGEISADASYTLGPVQVVAGTIWAPSQDAIGGSNLYFHAGADAGIPGTPLTLSGSIGRTSGTTDDPVRAARLRPAGRYTDWQVGLEHVTGPLTLALDYVGSDVAQARIMSPLGDRRHSGDRILGRARLSF